MKSPWLDIDSDELADLTLQMVKIPSPTGDEQEFSEFYAKTLEDFGMEVKFDYVEAGRKNVIAKLAGSGTGPNILLHGHMDTVPIGSCVQPSINDGRVYGRGSIDMKGSLAAIAVASKKLIDSGVHLNGDLFVAGTIDHERPVGQGKGMKELVNFLRKNSIKLDGAINTEGPFDGLKIAQGGCAFFSIALSREGGTLYAATSPLASNPILWVSDLIVHLGKMDKEIESHPRHPLIPQRPTVQIGTIQGGDFLFSVPDSVKLEGAFRWEPGEDFARVSHDFASSLQELENSLRNKYDKSIKISVQIRVDEEECEVPSDSRIVTSVRKALKNVTAKDYPLTGSRFVTDLPGLTKEAGIESVEFGPTLPDDMTAHTDHESVKIDHLSVLSKTFVATALDFCGTR